MFEGGGREVGWKGIVRLAPVAERGRRWRRLSGLVDLGCHCPTGRVERSPPRLRSGTCATGGSTSTPCKPRRRSRPPGPCAVASEPAPRRWQRTGPPTEGGTRTRTSHRRVSPLRRWDRDRPSIAPGCAPLAGAQDARRIRPGGRAGRDGTRGRSRCEPVGTRHVLRSGPSVCPGVRQACSSRIKGTSSVLRIWPVQIAAPRCAVIAATATRGRAFTNHGSVWATTGRPDRPSRSAVQIGRPDRPSRSAVQSNRQKGPTNRPGVGAPSPPGQRPIPFDPRVRSATAGCARLRLAPSASAIY